MKRLVLLAVAGVVSGCMGPPKVISSSARTIVVSAKDSAYAKAQSLADKECSKYSRHARLIARPGPSNAEFIFDCIE